MNAWDGPSRTPAKDILDSKKWYYFILTIHIFPDQAVKWTTLDRRSGQPFLLRQYWLCWTEVGGQGQWKSEQFCLVLGQNPDSWKTDTGHDFPENPDKNETRTGHGQCCPLRSGSETISSNITWIWVKKKYDGISRNSAWTTLAINWRHWSDSWLPLRMHFW